MLSEAGARTGGKASLSYPAVLPHTNSQKFVVGHRSTSNLQPSAPRFLWSVRPWRYSLISHKSKVMLETSATVYWDRIHGGSASGPLVVPPCRLQGVFFPNGKGRRQDRKVSAVYPPSSAQLRILLKGDARPQRRPERRQRSSQIQFHRPWRTVGVAERPKRSSASLRCSQKQRAPQGDR